MRLGITGGGTGGHVFPALEVARLARERGHALLYLGSMRGQEGDVCRRESIEFRGFASEPLYSLRSARGVRAAFRILVATSRARAALRAWKPDAVFSTGGYSAAPVVGAARRLGIPYVLLEANSAPGRSNLMFAKQASAVATVFRSSEGRFPGCRVVRTGLPIRKALREAAAGKRGAEEPNVLITGGSQGSEFLNTHVPPAAALMGDAELGWLHVAGKAHADDVGRAAATLGLGKRYRIAPFLEADQMAAAYAEASLIVCRSGGSLAEVALFGLPSVLVPLPSAAGDHQTHNAREFVEMGGAVLHPQAGSTSEKLRDDIRLWLDDADRRERAAAALKAFDVPDATERVLALVEAAK